MRFRSLAVFSLLATSLLVVSHPSIASAAGCCKCLVEKQVAQVKNSCDTVCPKGSNVTLDPTTQKCTCKTDTLITGPASGADCTKTCPSGTTSSYYYGEGDAECKIVTAKTQTATDAASAAKAAKIPALSNPLGSVTIPVLLGRIINAFLGISGSIALLMFVYGALTWITSGGSPERIKQGRETMIWTVLGIALIFSSYAIITFVLRTLGG